MINTVSMPMPTPNKNMLLPKLFPMREDKARLFDLVVEETLHGHRELFDSLTLTERETVVKWLSDAVVGGQNKNIVHDVLWEVDYIRKPVGIGTFLSDDAYMGRVCSELHPRWREDLLNVLGIGSKIAEWVLTGAIGVGKTTVAMAAIAYKIYCLSCLRSPAQYYGLLPDSLIVFGIYSITKRQVADAGYFKLRGFLDTSPYFRNTYPRSRKIDSKVVFPDKNVQVIPGSQELHALGLDLYAISLDEVNFMRAKNDKESNQITGQAYDLYNATHTRILSRFMRPGGTIPGLMLLMSSRKAQTSFLEEHLKKVKNSPHTYISDYPLWDTKPLHRFTLPKFKVEIGDRIARSHILKPDEKARKGARIIEIPGEYLPSFHEDIDQALRDIAGVATFNISPLIRDRQSVFDAIRKNLVHPFSRQVVTIDVSDDILLDEFFLTRITCRIEKSKWVPKLNPTCPRFIHVDIGLTGDCAGIAMSHLSGKRENERVNADGTISKITNPFVVVDFMLRIAPPPGSEIDLSKIRSFIFFIKRIFPLALVTFDGFQSAGSIQELKREGVDCRILSVDRDDDAYLSLRSALFDRRIAMYEYQPFINEVLDLERDIRTRKVDHPQRATIGGKGSKDVADAVSGSVFVCLNDPRALALIPAIGDLDTVSMPKKPKIVDPQELETATMSVPVSGAPEAITPVSVANVRQIGGKGVNWEALRGNIKT